MFKHNGTTIELTGAVLFMTLLVAPRTGDASFFKPEADVCGDVSPVVSRTDITMMTIGLNSTVSGYGGGEEYFAVEIPEPGILNVELTVPGSALVEPKLAPVEAPCGSSKGRYRKVLNRSVFQLLLAIEKPGIFLFRGAAHDSLMPLGAFKLTTGFVALEPPTLSDPERLPSKEDPDPEVIEIEPEQQVIEIQPDSGLQAGLRELCRAAELDDHADRFLCAMSVNPGEEVLGIISHSQGGDDDLFQLLLPSTPEATVWTVTLETTGEIDTFGSLYDRDSHRLAADDDGGNGANFRIVKALVSGSYFIRVEGDAGIYSLKVSASAW